MDTKLEKNKTNEEQLMTLLNQVQEPNKVFTIQEPAPQPEIKAEHVDS